MTIESLLDGDYAMRDRNFTTTVKKNELLKTLRENLERHKKIVAESREGFLKKCAEVFEKHLEEVSKGKVKRFSIHLDPPQDHSQEYETVIAMMEWNTGDEVELTAEEFRNFVLDEFDWLGAFLFQNRRFSDTATEYASSKSHLINE